MSGIQSLGLIEKINSFSDYKNKAIRCEEISLSYSELIEQADAYAYYLVNVTKYSCRQPIVIYE